MDRNIKILISFGISLALTVGIFFAYKANEEPIKNALTLGAPTGSVRYERELTPETDSKFYLGTTSPSLLAWRGLIVDEVCLAADCRTSWPAGGSGGADFPNVQSWGNATSTTLGFLNGFLSTASSTIVGDATTTGSFKVSGIFTSDGGANFYNDDVNFLLGTALNLYNQDNSGFGQIYNNGSGVSSNFVVTASGQGDDLIVNTVGKIGIASSTPYARLSIQSKAGDDFSLWVGSTTAPWLRVSNSGFGTTTLSGLNIAGSATSTSNVGINLSAGCFAIGGTCLSTGGSGLTSYDAWTHPASGKSATTSEIQTTGFLSTASSTFMGDVRISSSSLPHLILQNTANTTNKKNLFIAPEDDYLHMGIFNDAFTSSTTLIRMATEADQTDGHTIIGIDAGPSYGFNDAKLAGGWTLVGYKAGNSIASNPADNQVAFSLVAVGDHALESNQTGSENVAVGSYALNAATNWYNTAVGHWAAYRQTTGISNTAIGNDVAWYNTTGSYNVSVGHQAAFKNAVGSRNVNVGDSTSYQSLNGDDNVIIGHHAMELSPSSFYNTVVGSQALLYGSTTGNTAVGYRAGFDANATGGIKLNNSLLGYQSGYFLSSGDNNVMLGYQAGDNVTTGSNNIIVGYDIDAPLVAGNNQLNIGNLIYGTGVSGSGSTISNATLGIATTTPQWTLQIASTTKSQLALTGNTTDDHWTFRSVGNNFYIATSSPTTFATSSVSALRIDSNGKVTANCFTNDGSTCIGGGGSPGGSGSEIQFRGDASTFSPIINSANVVSGTGMFTGFGTTTPRWLLNLASSTDPQLSLSDGSLTSPHWTMRNAGGTFYLSTSSPSTFATSTTDALLINNVGQVFIAPFGVTSGVAANVPGLIIGKSSNQFGQMLEVSKNNTNLIMVQSYSTTPTPGIRGISGRGTLASPSQTLSGDTLFQISARGYSNTGSLVNANTSSISLVASEDFTGSSIGSRITFGTTPIGGTTVTERMRLDDIGRLGIGTTSPWSTLSLGRTNIASSSISVSEYRYGGTNMATSTAHTIDCRTSNQIKWPIGTSATTLTLTGLIPGQKCIVIVENPNASAGALTWAVSGGYTLLWAGGTTPTQTTTANKQDVWSFLATQASSTITILGAQSANF